MFDNLLYIRLLLANCLKPLAWLEHKPRCKHMPVYVKYIEIRVSGVLPF